MSGCPRLPRAMSVGRCGGDSLAASAAELLVPREERDVLNLSLPVRSLEISPWNDAEWLLIPPVVSSSILEVRNGMQIVYDMLMNCISSTRASTTAHNQVAARLDAYHLKVGKRISTMEMKLDTAHLTQSDILEKLNAQQKDISQHTDSTNARLDAQFERTKLLVDSALRKFNPPTDMELDAIALRLSSNLTLLTAIKDMQVEHSQESLQLVQALNSRLEDVEQQLNLCRKNSQELVEIVENNEKHFKQYQARIGDRLRLLDELPARLEQLEATNQIYPESCNNDQETQIETVAQEMKGALTALKDELNELRASLTDNIRRIESSSLRSHDPHSFTVPSTLPPIQSSRASSSNRKGSATPYSSRAIESTPRGQSTSSTSSVSNSDRKSVEQRYIQSTDHTVQQYISTTRKSSIQPQSTHIKSYNESEDEYDDKNKTVIHHSPRYTSGAVYLDEPEFYQDCHRPVAKRVDPQRYKSTVVLATDKKTQPRSANVQSTPTMAVRDILPQISAQLPHNSKLIQGLVAKLIPELLNHFRTGWGKPEKEDNAYPADVQDRLGFITQQIEPLNASVSFMMSKIEAFSQTLNTVIEPEMKVLADKVEQALAVTTNIPQKHADLISKVNRKMELVRESLQLCISSNMKSTMDSISLRDSTYATKTAMAQLSRSIAGTDTRLSLHEDVILQLYRRLYSAANPSVLGSFTDVAHELGVDTYVHDPPMAVPTNSSANSELSVGSATFRDQLSDEHSRKLRTSKRPAVISAPPTKTKQNTQVLPGQSHLAASCAPTRNEDPIRISPSLKVSYYDTNLPDSAPLEKGNNEE